MNFDKEHDIAPKPTTVASQAKLCRKWAEDWHREIDEMIAAKSELDDLGPIELSRVFVKIRLLKDEMDAIMKGFDAFYEELAKVKLPAVFDAHKVPSVSLDEGYRVTVSHALRASIRGGVDKEAAYQWLNENGLGDIVTRTVNASTLSAVAKTMAEDNRELDSELFNVAVLANTSFNRIKGK